MNDYIMPEGFVADPGWLQGIARACRHNVDMIHTAYQENPDQLTMEDVAQLNIMSAYLYLYSNALNNNDTIVASAEEIIWH
jgi:hypothetical protein